MILEVTSTEIQNSFGTYLKYAQYEDVYITRNGRRVAVLKSYADVVAERKAVYGEKTKMSLEEFLDFAEQSEERYEYIDGEIILLSSPSFQHQVIVTSLGSLLRTWSKGKPCEALVAPFDVILQNEDLASVVQPDVLLICDLENINDKGRYRGIPTIVVEVLSESSRSYDMIKKLDVYRTGGIKEYWVVNPFNEEVYVYIFTDYDITDYQVFSRVVGQTVEINSPALSGKGIALEQIFGE